MSRESAKQKGLRGTYINCKWDAVTVGVERGEHREAITHDDVVRPVDEFHRANKVFKENIAVCGAGIQNGMNFCENGGENGLGMGLKKSRYVDQATGESETGLGGLLVASPHSVEDLSKGALQLHQISDLSRGSGCGHLRNENSHEFVVNDVCHVSAVGQID
jgi:hypothetical protein